MMMASTILCLLSRLSPVDVSASFASPFGSTPTKTSSGSRVRERWHCGGRRAHDGSQEMLPPIEELSLLAVCQGGARRSCEPASKGRRGCSQTQGHVGCSPTDRAFEFQRRSEHCHARSSWAIVAIQR